MDVLFSRIWKKSQRCCPLEEVSSHPSPCCLRARALLTHRRRRREGGRPRLRAHLLWYCQTSELSRLDRFLEVTDSITWRNFDLERICHRIPVNDTEEFERFHV